MKVLLINGSPRGEQSNTLPLAKSFVEGIVEKTGAEVEEITLLKKDIKPCCGCFRCWGLTPGECVIHDAMDVIRAKIMEADFIVESYPLYFFGMPSGMKEFTDRCMPLMKSYEGESASDKGQEQAFHEPRFDMTGKKLMVISTCGYTNTERIYEALLREYDFICGPGRYSMLMCPQGELFGLEQFGEMAGVYRKHMKEAGAEYAEMGSVSEEKKKELARPMIPPRAFEMMLKANWQKKEV